MTETKEKKPQFQLRAFDLATGLEALNQLPILHREQVLDLINEVLGVAYVAGYQNGLQRGREEGDASAVYLNSVLTAWPSRERQVSH